MDLWYKWYSTFSQHCHVIKTCRLNSWNIICLLVDTHWIHGQLTNIMDNSWLCDGWDWSSIGIMLMEYLSRIGDLSAITRATLNRHTSADIHQLTHNQHSIDFCPISAMYRHILTNTQPMCGPSGGEHIGWYSWLTVPTVNMIHEELFPFERQNNLKVLCTICFSFASLHQVISLKLSTLLSNLK